MKPWRRPKSDKVTPELREYVMRRDDGCIAPDLDLDADLCYGRLTLDHVKDAPRMGVRAPSDRAHLACVCLHHHMDGWATSHRPLLREYLRRVEPVEEPAA